MVSTIQNVALVMNSGVITLIMSAVSVATMSSCDGEHKRFDETSYQRQTVEWILDLFEGILLPVHLVCFYQ
jgi:hypothetical protein